MPLASNLSCVICPAAAQAAGICYITSTYASCTLEDIVAAAPRGFRWFQLYVQPDRQLNKQLVQRVESLGFRALVITVDVPKLGNRRHDIRNQLNLKTNLLLKDLRSPQEVGKIQGPMGRHYRRQSPFCGSSLPSFHKNSLSACPVPDTGDAAELPELPDKQSVRPNVLLELSGLSPEVFWPGPSAENAINRIFHGSSNIFYFMAHLENGHFGRHTSIN